MTLDFETLFGKPVTNPVDDADIMLIDDEAPNHKEFYTMTTGEFDVPNTDDPTTGTVVKEDGKDVPTQQRKKDTTPMAKVLVVAALKMETVLVIVLADHFKRFRASMGLSDDFKPMVVHSRTLDYGDFPERPADKPLRVHGLERNGYRFTFDPEGDTSQSSLTVRAQEAGFKSHLEFLMHDSGILNEDPSVRLIVDTILTNTGKDGNMTKEVANMLLQQANEMEYLKTKFTTRDLKTFIDTISHADLDLKQFATEKEKRLEKYSGIPLRMARRVMKKTLDAAKTLYDANKEASAKMSFVLLPELCALDKDEKACVQAVFRKYDELFQEGYTRLEMEEVNPWCHDALVETTDGKSTVPRLMLVNDAEYRGPVILRGFENDRDHPTYRLMSKAVRLAMKEEVWGTSLHHAPRLVASFSGPGKVFLQSDAKDGAEMDLTPFALALRVAELQERNDLSTTTKAKALANPALLESVDAPEYVRDKKSYVILSKSRLQCGNDFDATSPELGISNEEIWNILVNVIERSRAPR